MKSLGTRLTAVMLVAMVTLAAIAAWITVRAAGAYHDELLQRLNGSIAMYIDQEAPLIRSRVVDEARLSELARRAMVINPIAEVYLLDPQGRVLDHRAANVAAPPVVVDLRPVRRFLAGASRGPIYGANPRAANETRIFSAAEIRSNGRIEGYVYVVLGGARHDSIASALSGSYILQGAVAGLAVVLLLAAGIVWAGTAWLTRPVRELHASVVRASNELAVRDDESAVSAPNDIAQVRAVFEAMARRLRRHIDSMKEVDRLRRELFTNVSHDLRTPLTSLRGYLETLQIQDATLTSSKRRHFLTIALRHCARVERLVEQLLSLARVDGLQVKLDPEAVAVAELAQDIVTKFQLRADEAGVRLEIQRDPAVPHAIADIALLECVFENLLDNALRHTPRGGTIAVRVCTGTSGVTVEVEDTGRGIPEADLVRVQRRFETGQGGHVGLGLAIVNRVLQLHGSQLELRSRPGEGTLARFALGTADPTVRPVSPSSGPAREESVIS